MADGFPQSYLTKRQAFVIQKAMRTPNPTTRKAMLRSVKR